MTLDYSKTFYYEETLCCGALTPDNELINEDYKSNPSKVICNYPARERAIFSLSSPSSLQLPTGIYVHNVKELIPGLKAIGQDEGWPLHAGKYSIRTFYFKKDIKEPVAIKAGLYFIINEEQRTKYKFKFPYELIATWVNPGTNHALYLGVTL